MGKETHCGIDTMLYFWILLSSVGVAFSLSYDYIVGMLVCC